MPNLTAARLSASCSAFLMPSSLSAVPVPMPSRVTPSIVIATVTVCGPSPSAVAGVQVHVPLAGTVMLLHAVAPSTVTTNLLPTSAVPVIIGVAWMFAPASGVTITAAAGATVSTVKVRGDELGLALPAASVKVAVTACVPSFNVAELQLHAPLPFASVTHTTAPPSVTVTVLFASAPVPSNVGTVVLT